jgi:hypothetical protein
MSLTFEIKYQPKIIQSEYKKYFQFQRDKVVFNRWYLLFVIISSSLLFFGLYDQNRTIIFIGIGFLFILLYIFTRVFVGAKFMLKKFLQNIQKSPLVTEGKYEVKFTSQAIVYQSQKIKNEIPWNKITSAEENKSAVYLHIEKNRLLDVFSEELNGKIEYRKILLEIRKHIPTKR